MALKMPSHACREGPPLLSLNSKRISRWWEQPKDSRMKVFSIVFLLCATALGGYAFPIQQDSTPTLISLSPSSAVQGAAIEVRLTGSNFAVGSTSVTPSSGLVVNSVHVDTSVTLRALLQVIGPPGTVNVSVTTLA